MADEDYLDPDDQEINEELEEDAFNKQLASCTSSEEVWNTAAANGLTFPAENELRKAVEDIKRLIYLMFFQTGPKERVHDTKILKEYVNFLGLLYTAIETYKRTGRPINIAAICNGQAAALKDGMENFFTILYRQIAMPATALQNSLRDQFLHLHFLCFPYCQTNQCLSMD